MARKSPAAKKRKGKSTGWYVDKKSSGEYSITGPKYEMPTRGGGEMKRPGANPEKSVVPLIVKMPARPLKQRIEKTVSEVQGIEVPKTPELPAENPMFKNLMDNIRDRQERSMQDIQRIGKEEAQIREEQRPLDREELSAVRDLVKGNVPTLDVEPIHVQKYVRDHLGPNAIRLNAEGELTITEKGRQRAKTGDIQIEPNPSEAKSFYITIGGHKVKIHADKVHNNVLGIK